VGDKVDAKYNATTKLAIRILARYKVAELHGTIAAVDTTASTVTVTPKDGGADVVLNVDTSTVIRLNGHLVTLADLQAGDKVVALYNKPTLFALTIFAAR
jgi:O-acetylhomoserine/O-acetylserine sulfhydrylase-like pyridoxal-dependent enzyme